MPMIFPLVIAMISWDSQHHNYLDVWLSVGSMRWQIIMTERWDMVGPCWNPPGFILCCCKMLSMAMQQDPIEDGGTDSIYFWPILGA
jgi:hypothetical protein